MRTAVLVALVVAVLAPDAHAQLPRPLPAFVVDLRGFYSGLGQDPVTAGDLGVDPATLPARGLGGVIGAHVFLLRGRRISIGLGGEAVLARGRAQAESAEALAPAPTIRQRLKGVSGMVSLNFGHRNGWSYLSAGVGPLSFDTTIAGQEPTASPPVQRTINLGAGARWFASRHVAFCFDLRFYQTEPELGTAYPGRQRRQVTVLSAGIAIR
jgi:hypothetical protein